MEGRRGLFKFHTLSRRFVYRWHLTMQSMRAWPKEKVSEVIFNRIVITMAMCIRLTYVRLSIHSTVIDMMVGFL